MRFVLRVRPVSPLMLLAAGSAAALAAAFIAQYGFGLAPCHLCLLQRYPHAAVVVLAALGYARGWRWALLPCAALLLSGFGIAAYHTALEYGLVAGPSGCTSTGPVPDSIEAMRAQIANAPLVPCDQPLGRVLGVSLAGWSALIYAFLILIAFDGIRRTCRLKQK